MNTPDTSPVQRAKQHPMLIAAAIAIIVFCLAGTAAIFGWLPSSIGSGGNSGELTASDRAALASSLNADDRAADTMRRQRRARARRRPRTRSGTGTRTRRPPRS
ncbi:hypothetical protein LP419_05430 [Massilia sp. H-1]|nr:hypothetical protein LP419_05430 [Massilia sp. H-1]